VESERPNHDVQPKRIGRRSEGLGARGIVVRLARGNVALQLGHYLTKRDLDELRDAVLNHEF